MKIVICTKQVPSVEEVRFDRERGTIIRAGVPNEINPFDRRALGQAVELKKQFGGEIVAVTMGPPQANEVLWECLAVGADRAVHINDPALAGSDTLATARVLAAFLAREMPDLVLCGKYSVDADTGQVGPEVAALLGMPQVAGATRLAIDGDVATVDRETDEGLDTLEVRLPLLLTASERLIRPPRVDSAALEAAKTAPIESLTAADLGLDAGQVGFAGSPTWVAGIDEVRPERATVLVQEGDAAAASARVLQLLEARGLFKNGRLSQQLDPLPSSAPQPRPEKAIWVVPELEAGRLTGSAGELLAAAARLGAQIGGQACALLIGHDVERFAPELAAAGADLIYVADDPRLAEYDAETYSWVLRQAIAAHSPWAVLVPATSKGRDYAPRVAAELGLGLTGDAIGLELDAEERLCQLKPAFGGTIVANILSKTMPQMATVRGGSLKPARPRAGVQPVMARLSLEGLATPRVRVTGHQAAANAGGERLDEAQIIVCAGAGLGGPQNLSYVEDLARSLHAVVGGTRRVVDAGWLPRQKQIGLTGVILAPELYIGIGVRGAFNHTIGILRAGTIVAINNDPDALIMQHADIAVVGDYRELTPALSDAFRQLN